MRKILTLSFILTLYLCAQSQVKYNNKSFLKEVSLWCNGGVLEALPAIESDLQGKFFSIRENGVAKGLAYVGRVNSCRSNGCSIASTPSGNFEYFDYYAIFDLNFAVRKISVFNYQATHGQEVTAKSWLKQFIGYNGSDRLDVGKNIDAISGATISTTSLTQNIQDVVNRLKQLGSN